MTDMHEPPDLAHIAHAELLTPFPDESLRFFVDLFGMEIEHQEGQSVFLRGWGEYQPYGLKLTEAKLPGLGHVAIRAWNPEALERRVTGIEATGLGERWIDGDHGHGRAYQFRDPDGHLFELFYEQDRYIPPEHLRPRLRNVPQRHVDRGAAVKRIDHVNILASDVAANRRFAQEQLGYRLYEQVILDNGEESGAWMSLSIAAHELIYTADHAGKSAPPARLHHLAWFVDTREECLRAADLFVDHDVPIEAAPSKHAVAQGMFLYVYEPGGNRVEVTTGTHFIYDPEYRPVAWTEAERARGQAWGVKTIDTFHTYGTPDVNGRVGPPIPPTSQIPGAPAGTYAPDGVFA
jgi:catechol 2,3-dioxygenase